MARHRGLGLAGGGVRKRPGRRERLGTEGSRGGGCGAGLGPRVPGTAGKGSAVLLTTPRVGVLRAPHPVLLLPSAPWHHIENLDLFFSRISFCRARVRRDVPSASRL